MHKRLANFPCLVKASSTSSQSFYPAFYPVIKHFTQLTMDIDTRPRNHAFVSAVTQIANLDLGTLLFSDLSMHVSGEGGEGSLIQNCSFRVV
jgi:hypothetical protein